MLNIKIYIIFFSRIIVKKFVFQKNISIANADKQKLTKYSRLYHFYSILILKVSFDSCGISGGLAHRKIEK